MNKFVYLSIMMLVVGVSFGSEMNMGKESKNNNILQGRSFLQNRHNFGSQF